MNPLPALRRLSVPALVFLAMFGATSPGFACVVGASTNASCTEAALDACLPGGGSFDGTVTFDCGGAATMTVTSTKTISADTTIDGGGVTTIIGGGPIVLLVVFSVNSGVTFTVQNLTITNSVVSSGFAIDNSGTLTVTNSAIDGAAISNAGAATVANTTLANNLGGLGALQNSGTLTVTNSAFSGNEPRAIRNAGTATVTNTTFAHGFSVTDGGAIFNLATGTLNVTDSTFSGNGASGNGGAVANEGGILTVTSSTFWGNGAGGFRAGNGGSGGAIFNVATGTLNVSDSTFFGNHSLGGGAIGNSGTATVTNSTFFRDSGIGILAISNSGTLTVTNSILATSGTWGTNCGGIITDGGHNIDDGTTCGFTGTGCSNTSGTSFCNTNPLLDPAGLASNGGPTQTIALEPGSLAINAGDETVCTAPPVNNLDQRGFVRPGLGATNCSIGAYEFDSPGEGTTTTTTITVASTTTTTSTTIVGTTTTTSTTIPHLILGKKLLIQDPTGSEAARKVLALGKESSTDIGPTIQGDPATSGATLRVIANGGTNSDQTYILDAGGWSALGTVGFKYAGPTGADADPVKLVLLKRTPGGTALLKVLIKGNVGTQSLDVVPPNLGADGGLILDINGGGRYCVAFGGAAGGTSTVNSAQAWTVVNPTAQPGCP
jgi:hypothetical protein